MAYLLGFIVADGCIVENKRRNNSRLLNITSKDKSHLYLLRKALSSEHKLSQKQGSSGRPAFQLQVKNDQITADLMALGVLPRKTYNLQPILVPDAYFADFFRGFFDGDGSVYIYKVNGVSQIKASFVGTSFEFVSKLNNRLAKIMKIPRKSIWMAFK